MHDPLTKRHYALELARRLSLPAQQLGRYIRMSPATRPRQAEPRGREIIGGTPRFEGGQREVGADEDGLDGETVQSVTPRPIPALEAKCLTIVSESPERMTEFVENQCCDLLTDKRVVYLIERVDERRKQVSEDTASLFPAEANALAQDLGDPDFHRQVVTALAQDLHLEDEQREIYFVDVLRQLQRQWLDREQDELERIATTLGGDPAKQDEWFERMREFNRVRLQLDQQYQHKLANEQAKQTLNKPITQDEQTGS